MKRYGMGSQLLVGALLLGLAGCGGEDVATETAAEEAVVLGPSDVQLAERSEISSAVVLTGSLDPYRRVAVRAQVPGVVTHVRVEEGDAVRAGQTLARIEAQGIRSQATGARAGVAAAEANLALAQRQLESARTLYEAGAMSEIDFRGAQAQYEAAQAQLAAARAQSAGAAEQAGRTVIEAPIRGEISEKSVDEGEAVNPGQALFTVVNSEFLELEGQIPVEQAARVRPGQPVEFTVDAYPGRVFRGEVARVDPTANPATRQVGVYVRLPNRDRGLVGGLFATGRVLAGDAREAVVVPAAAVRGSGADAYVWAVEDGTIVRRPVTTGVRDEARGVVAITSGLTGGEQVVVAPGELEEGLRVRVAAENTAGTPAAEGR
jgi:membrane fusion protein (multidrug efflux system)